MKEWAHLFVATAMAVTTLSIFIVTQSNDNVKPLDTVRFYTRKWEKGDTGSALSLLQDKKTGSWMTAACQASTNLTLDPACLDERTRLRNSILIHMRCTEYGSQACAYLRMALKALVRTGTDRVQPGNLSSPFKQYGSSLKGEAANGQTYREILVRIVEEVQRLFHGAFRAEESDKTLVLRSALYNLITWAIMGNLAMHVADSFDLSSQLRMAVRAITFVVVFLTATIFFFINMGNALVLGLIILSGAFSLCYFEMFLDPTIIRPWIHPFVFSTVYMSTTVLSLVENGILDYNLIVIHLLISMAVGQIFMSMVWYFVGLSEKLRLSGRYFDLYKVYVTKETQIALLGSILLVVVMPLHQIMAPYNFTAKSMFLALAPLVFAVLSVISIIYIQSMPLDDAYGEDEDRKRRGEWKAHKGDAIMGSSTEINGAKIYSSLLLLLYGAVITMIYLSEHVQTFRAYLDAMPEDSIQYDTINPSRSFLMGRGLTLM